MGIRWTVEIATPPVIGAAPVSDAERVYLALRTGQIVARRNNDGAEAWSRDLATERPLAIDGGFLFVASSDALHALRGDNGAIAWEVPMAAPTAPLLAHAGWLIAVADGKLLAYRAKDGTLVWQRAVGPVSRRPAIDGDRLYVATDDGRILALDLKAGAPAWEQRLDGRPGEPVASGDRIYVGGGDRHLYCLKAKDGEIAWQVRVGTALDTYASADDDHIYFVGYDYVLRALDRHSGVQQWQHGLRRRAGRGPVVMHDVVFVPSSSSTEIWAWTADGQPAGTMAIPAQPASPPDFVDAGAEGARVYVVTGSLASVWELTFLGPVGDPPVVPLAELPGTTLPVDDQQADNAKRALELARYFHWRTP